MPRLVPSPKHLAAPVALAAALASPSAAQVFEDPGPHLAGWREVTFPSGVTIPGRVYYPALSAGEDAPADPGLEGYPLFGIVHGQSFKPSSYDNLSLHLASWGFVVVSVGPLGGALHGPPNASKKMRDMFHWMEQQSADPTSPFQGLASDAPWSAMGHSFGGAAMQYLVVDEPRVTAVVGVAPLYEDGPGPAGNLAEFDGTVLTIGGELDPIVPVIEHAIPMYEEGQALGRAYYVEVLGSGHYGSIDVEPAGLSDTTPFSEQNRIHRKVLTAFLLAEIQGDEDACVAFLGEGKVGEPFASECSSLDPPLWLQDSAVHPGTVTLGLGGRAQETAWLAVSPRPNEVAVRAGVIGLDLTGFDLLYTGPLDASGVHELSLPVPVSGTGRTFYVQGAVWHEGGAKLTRTELYLAP